MKIYIASSWKMKATLYKLANILRLDGHYVDLFCDDSKGRYVFNWQEIEQNLSKLDVKSFLENPRSYRAFQENKVWIEWADAVLMVYPCGNSSHLEAGYAKGLGKKFYLYGEFPKGYFETMYHFTDGIFEVGELERLRTVLKGGNKEKSYGKIVTINSMCPVYGFKKEKI